MFIMKCRKTGFYKIFKATHANKFFILFIPLITLIFIIISPAESIFAAKCGFFVWEEKVFPALFPFFVCSELLIKSGIIKFVGCFFDKLMYPLFKQPGQSAFAFLAGSTGGYPLGAKITCSLYAENEISKGQAERLLAFTNNASPAFIMGSVASAILGKPEFGTILFSAHILSSFLVGILSRFYPDKSYYSKFKNENFKNKIKKALSEFNNGKIDLGKSLTESIKNSLISVTVICGFIVFFSVLTTFIGKTILNPENTLFNCVFSGAIEMTNGLNYLSGFFSGGSFITNPFNVRLCICAASFVLGFGGICIHFQVYSIISRYELSIVPYITGKIIQGFLAALICFAALS